MGDIGCTNHGCPFTEPGGMKTNGSCKCVYTLVRSAKDGERNVNLVANELGREFRKRNKRIAELEAERQWISVEDRLPEIDDVVLVHRYGLQEPFIGTLLEEIPTFEETFDTFTYWDDARNDGQHWDDVTHWMPLPEPPKEKDNEI